MASIVIDKKLQEKILKETNVLFEIGTYYFEQKTAA